MANQAIEYFTGEYNYLSNFYPSTLRYDGIVFPTVEHAFQAQKTFDIAERKNIAIARSPGSAKQLGRRVQLRKDWESVKVELMTKLVRVKFETHTDLRAKLASTGDAPLIEGNTWNDRFGAYAAELERIGSAGFSCRSVKSSPKLKTRFDSV